MAEWCAVRTQAEVIAAFTAAEAAIGPVYDMADIAADPHYAARGAIADVDGTPMQGLIARLRRRPGRLRWTGRPLDADGDDIRTFRLDLTPATCRIARAPVGDRVGSVRWRGRWGS